MGYGQCSMEGLAMSDVFWRGKKVLVTGHTGFKGSWLTLLLHGMGARVVGYSLSPSTQPNLYTLVGVDELCEKSYIADIRDADSLKKAFLETKPDIVLHLAAQPLVRQSYSDPVETYTTNVIGTVHVLEAIRETPSVRVCVVVTTDKCYENREQDYAYCESDPLGGHDPYSSSKACAEIVVAAYRRSFFEGGVSVSTARAGNVIGGGDWSEDRLIPDAVKAFAAGESFSVRNPKAIRPWQHVLDPLVGYLQLAEKQWNSPEEYSRAFNFGPDPKHRVEVREVADILTQSWGEGAHWEAMDSREDAPHEAAQLALDISQTCERVGWKPRFSYQEAIARTALWYKKLIKNPAAARTLCEEDINLYYTSL